MPIVQVHPDAGEIGRVFRPALGIVSDLECVRRGARGAGAGAVRAGRPGPRNLRSLREAQRAVPNYRGHAQPRHRRCASWKALLEPRCDRHHATPATSPAGRRASSTSATASATSGRPTARWATACRPRSAPRSPIPDRQVVALVGDGGFMMTGQELATAFHHGVAPIVLVFNNQMYGTIRMHQERTYPGRVSGTAADQPGFRQVHRGLRRPWRGGERRPPNSRRPSAARWTAAGRR